MTYSIIRRYFFADGDILLFNSHGWQHRYITQPLLGFKWSHVGLLCRWNDRWMLLESVARKGTIARPVSAAIAKYHGDVWLYRYNNVLSGRQREMIVRRAQVQLGKDYGTKEALWLGIRLFLKKCGVKLEFDTRDSLSWSQRLFCSWYVADAYTAAGIDLIPLLNDQEVTPDMLAERLYPVAQIPKPQLKEESQ